MILAHLAHVELSCFAVIDGCSDCNVPLHGNCSNSVEFSGIFIIEFWVLLQYHLKGDLHPSQVMNVLELKII